MIELQEVIREYLQTEKGTEESRLGKYFFRIHPQANKLDIKKAIETLFKVHVTKVNTMVVPGRPKRVRQVLGQTSEWKKAVVTLKQGEKIEVV